MTGFLDAGPSEAEDCFDTLILRQAQDDNTGLSHLPAFFRDAFIGKRVGHSDGAGVVGASRREYDTDLHACPESPRSGRQKPVGWVTAGSASLNLPSDCRNPTSERRNPPLRNGIPPLRNGIPPLRNDIPTLRSDNPTLRNDIPTLRSDIPTSDCPHPISEMRGLTAKIRIMTWSRPLQRHRPADCRFPGLHPRGGRSQTGLVRGF